MKSVAGTFKLLESLRRQQPSLMQVMENRTSDFFGDLHNVVATQTMKKAAS